MVLSAKENHKSLYKTVLSSIFFRILHVGPDLVEEPWEHSNNNTISWLDVLEGKLKCRYYLLFTRTKPACPKDLKGQTRLFHLPDYLRHHFRIVLKETVAADWNS